MTPMRVHLAPTTKRSLYVLLSGVLALGACRDRGGTSTGGDATGQVTIAVRAGALGTRADIAAIAVQLTRSSDGDVVENAASATADVWSAAFPRLAVGSYSIYARAVDIDGVVLFESPRPYPGGDLVVTAGIRVTLLLQEAHPGPGPTNAAPYFISLTANQTELFTGAPIALRATAVDPDPSNTLSFTWSSNGGGAFAPAQTAGGTSSISFAPPGAGVFSLTVTVSDNQGASASLSITIQVTDPAATGAAMVSIDLNSFPQLSSLTSSNAQAEAGQALPLTAVAHDPDGDTLTFTWSASCAGSFGTGATSPDALGIRDSVVFTPAAIPDGGRCLLSVSVDDGRGGAVVGTLTVAFPQAVVGVAPTYFTTKTPYRPQQDPASYELPPAGFAPVFTQLVARHGSRGLSSVKYDAATYNLWQKALADGALTPLGVGLGPDVQRLMRANALLGLNVPGISSFGYGNLTQLGISEHRQLAQRLLRRLPEYFDAVANSADGPAPRQLVVISSGVDRAVDSAAFFAGSLGSHSAALASLIARPPAPIGYPAGMPSIQPAGINRFLLYFHKLVPKTDLVTDPADPYFDIYQASQAYQSYAADPNLNAKLSAIATSPSVAQAARLVLERLFNRDFVDKIDDGTYSFSNAGSFTFVSDDGGVSTTVTGDGKTTVKSLPDAVSMLYNLYVITPALAGEAPIDFSAYLPAPQAAVLAYQQDAQDFYQMGPGVAEQNPITYRMAQGLEDDFFGEVDAVARGDLSHGAKLRFTHAEIIVPFATLLGLKGIFAPAPASETYSYENNPWRGELVSPMAANVQWDVYRDAGAGDGGSSSSSALLVKMLYNEREIDFKAGCDGARHAAGSHYYDYDKLTACYGHVAAPPAR
jgi:hypothetical protein